MRLALLSQNFVQVLSLAAISVQMRLVPKADFAIFGLAVLLVEFPRMLTTMGVGAAVIQKEQIDDDQLSFLFWLNQLFGLLAMGASIAAAPFFIQPGDAEGLFPVAAVLASSSLFAALARVPQAILERELRIAVIAQSQWISMGVASLVAILMSFAGLRVWSLVAHQCLEVALFSLILWPRIAWRPSFPSLRGYSADLFHYANAFTLSQWIHWLGQRFDRYWLWRLLAGSTLGLEWVGLYTQTMNLLLRPALMITGPLTGILLSSLARTSGDKQALESLHHSVLRFAAITLCPTCFGLIATADESLYLLGGDQWRAAAGLLALLGLLMIARAAINLAVIALAASGRSLLIVGVAIASSLVLVVAALFATSTGGSFDSESASAEAAAMRMAFFQTVATVLLIFPPMLWICAKALGASFGSLLWPWARPVVVSLVMAAIVAAARQGLVVLEVPPLARLALLAPLGAVIYILPMLTDIHWALTFLRQGRFAESR